MVIFMAFCYSYWIFTIKGPKLLTTISSSSILLSQNYVFIYCLGATLWGVQVLLRNHSCQGSVTLCGAGKQTRAGTCGVSALSAVLSLQYQYVFERKLVCRLCTPRIIKSSRFRS